MLGLLQLDGYELVNDPSGADFAVVNTCGFIEAAPDRIVRRNRRDARPETPRQTARRDRVGLPCRTTTGIVARITSRYRSPGWRFRPRARHESRRPPPWRPHRTTHHIPPGPHASAPRYGSAADHTAALRVSKNLRRLRPPLHVLRDSQNARQARHEADGRSARRSKGIGCRWRSRASRRRPRHDLLRPRPLRRTAARGASPRA